MRTKLSLISLALLVEVVLSLQTEKKNYDEYSVLRAYPASQEDLDLLHSIAESVSGWTAVSGPRASTSLPVSAVDLLVSPQQKPLLRAFLNCSGLEFTTTILDLQRAIEVENVEGTRRPEFKGSCSSQSGMSWSRYQSYDTMLRYMECLATTYDSLVSLFNIGYSSEGKPLKLVKIGRGSRQKKAIWIDGGIHAREWISPATASFIMRELAENSRAYNNILDKYDIFIMPSMNPDGYEYSRNYDRMWRKTRSTNRGSNCIGTDPNRNWGYNWGLKGASKNPCHETYRGAFSFSEPETRAVRDFILARKSSIEMYLTLHSYGQMFLYPWGYDRLDHSREYELRRLGNVGARAMGRGYTVGSAAKVLYPAAGGSDDWAFGGADIPYSYTIELPDTGSSGFILPASQIQTVGMETRNAVVAMINDLSTNRG